MCVCVIVYMYMLEWHFLFRSGLPDPASENIPAVKKICNAWFFSHNDICFENKNIFSIWAKNQNNTDGNKKLL